MSNYPLYDTLRTMKDTDRAYLAAMIDGEGSVSIVSGGHASGYVLRVWISNNHLGVLEYLKQTTGHGYIAVSYRGDEIRATQYALRATQNEAKALLDLAKEFIIIRRPQLELAEEFWAARDIHGKASKRWPPEVLAQFITRARQLNAKGPKEN